MAGSDATPHPQPHHGAPPQPHKPPRGLARNPRVLCVPCRVVSPVPPPHPRNAYFALH